MLYDCILYIFSYLPITKLCQFTCLSKAYHNVIDDTIKLYSCKKIKKCIRYSITIDNLYLFMLLQSYISKDYVYCLLRYACCRKNEIFINHIINTYNMETYIGTLCTEMIRYNKYKRREKEPEIIYRLYFKMLISDIREIDKINQKYKVFNQDFYDCFYKLYIQFYDEFDYRWMLFKMD